MKKTKVGIFGTAIKGYVERTIRMSGDGERFEFVDLNLPTKAVGGAEGSSALGSLKKGCHLLNCVRFVDVVIVVFVGNRSEWVSRIARFWGKKVIFFWIGSDVHDLMQGRSRGLEKDPQASLHLACSHNLIEELASFGIEAKLQVVPPALSFDVSRVPSDHAILLSLPDARYQFYGYDDLIRLIRDFPETPFYVVRTEKPELYDEPNVVFAGMLDQAGMDDIFDKISISIRFPEHDSWSMISAEATLKGKTVITKFPFPGAVHARDYDELKAALTRALQKPPACNMAAREEALKVFDAVRAGKTWVAYLDEVGLG